MTRSFLHVLCSLAALSSVHAYFLVGVKNFITTQRLDPIVSPGQVSSHAHSVVGGSNFGFTTDTATLRKSQCTSMPIEEDNSNYWFPHLYFQRRCDVSVTNVQYYLYDDQSGKTTAFPDNLRMLSGSFPFTQSSSRKNDANATTTPGNPLLRTYDPSSYAQQAVTFLCLDFNGQTTRHNGLPTQSCPSGVRAQINFPSCWDGKNTDSPDHKSHVAFRSGGPDVGDCKDPNFPVTLPRVFIEVYWNTEMDAHRSEAMNTTQPYVFAHGDRTGYGYHADFLNGWKEGVLQNVVDKCHCNPYGDAQCCADQGIFTLKKDGTCRITDSVDEQSTPLFSQLIAVPDLYVFLTSLDTSTSTSPSSSIPAALGTLPKLPGNNPVQEEGRDAVAYKDNVTPAILSPVYVYTGDSPAKGQSGNIVSAASTAAGTGAAPAASSGSDGNGNGNTSAGGASASVTSSVAPTRSASASTSASESHSEPESTAASAYPSSYPSSPASGAHSHAHGHAHSQSDVNNSSSSSESSSPASPVSGSASSSDTNSDSASASNSNSNSNSNSATNASTHASSSSNSGSNSGSGSGSAGSPASPASSAKHTCSHGKNRHNPGSPASGAAPQQIKYRSLHKARSFGNGFHAHGGLTSHDF
ncbi:hypothetical protein D9758_012271 [Tetrapyrgos nigripes]|uniref:DUF1996 domain-containing protein n=1 Tax=Tetrapyrgos nigripes TaxID=182062 RepID=A0A8H5FLQ8_9AGAR|nr:hypothetical protein D9758_012271 [Tetrapyrgos nigripes]